MNLMVVTFIFCIYLWLSKAVLALVNGQAEELLKKIVTQKLNFVILDHRQEEEAPNITALLRTVWPFSKHHFLTLQSQKQKHNKDITNGLGGQRSNHKILKKFPFICDNFHNDY